MLCIFLVVISYRESSGWLDITSLTIVLTHFQLSNSYFTYDFDYPEVVKGFVKPLGFSSGIGFVFDGLQAWASPSCMAGGAGGGDEVITYSAWWMVKMAIPILFMTPLITIAIVEDSKQRAEHEADKFSSHVLGVSEYDERKARQVGKKSAVQTILIIVFSAIMHGVSGSVYVWYCPKYDDGVFRLSSEPTIECTWENSEYKTLLLASLCVFIIYYAGTAGMLVGIIECEQGRRAAAEHHVTHAR